MRQYLPESGEPRAVGDVAEVDEVGGLPPALEREITEAEGAMAGEEFNGSLSHVFHGF